MQNESDPGRAGALKGISESTAAEILAFRDDRRWMPFHNPKDLAMSVSIEAGELLEVFQWSGADLECGDKRGALADELADVLIYAAMLADRAGLSMDAVVREKLAKNAARYPVEKVAASAPSPICNARRKAAGGEAESTPRLGDASEENAHDHDEDEGAGEVLPSLRR